MNQTQQETDAATEVVSLHWTYRVLRSIAYFGLAGVFWSWVILLAMSGRF